MNVLTVEATQGPDTLFYVLFDCYVISMRVSPEGRHDAVGHTWPDYEEATTQLLRAAKRMDDMGWIVSQPPMWRDVEGIDLIALRDLAGTVTINVTPYVVSVATGRWP